MVVGEATVQKGAKAVADEHELVHSMLDSMTVVNVALRMASDGPLEEALHRRVLVHADFLGGALRALAQDMPELAPRPPSWSDAQEGGRRR